MSDSIPADQISYKKKVGTLGSDPIIEVGLVGGLHLMLRVHDGKVETVGTGSHRAVCRHIAKKRYSEIKWTELSKADDVSEEHFRSLLPRYEEMTKAFRRLEGSEE